MTKNGVLAPTVRSVLSIDESRCDGCGLCLPSCAEGALRIENGKVRIIADKLCDGLGNCLGHCPRGALRLEERLADPYDRHAAEAAPGSTDKKIRLSSGDKHWPLKLQLVPLGAAFLQNSHLLLAADCAGLAAANFPERYLPGKTALLVCPKLESKDAIVDKLAHILQQCDIQSLTLVRMEVPCCCLPDLLRRAVEKSGDSRIAEIPVKTVVLTRFGQEKMPGLGMVPLSPPARKARRDLSERPKAAPPAKREQARPPAKRATP